ncbi:response regulator transcription factor [Flavobacterium sp.]|uniref:response regulator transcription factor n=1 Tax=Flavobacterium sp. TaxID=239 RepID=UPI0039E5AB87
MPFSKHKQVIYYGLTLALLLFVLRWLELRYVIFSHGFEIYAGAIAVIFTALGVWLAAKLTQPKTIVVEKQTIVPVAEFVFNATECEALGISKRELEVLQLMAKGMSNNEIAAELFVSLNTIKTHGARLFEKLEVNRRTQAVEKAKRIRLIP